MKRTMRHGWEKDYEMMRPLDGLPPSGIAFVDTISHDDEELRRRRNEKLEQVAEEIAQKAALRVEESRRKRDDACRARLLAKKLRDAEKAKQIARESVVEMTTDELAKFDSEVILIGADEAIMRLNQRHKNKLAIAENAKKMQGAN